MWLGESLLAGTIVAFFTAGNDFPIRKIIRSIIAHKLPRVVTANTPYIFQIHYILSVIYLSTWPRFTKTGKQW